MSTKKTNLQADEINFLEVILYLWKQKFLILPFCLTFLIAGFIYGIYQPKIYKTTVTLQKAPETLFSKYNLYFQKDFENFFDNTLKLNFLSFDNFIEFAKKNNKINELESTFKNNIGIEKYFKENFNLKKNEYTLFLFYEKTFQGEDFLNDYIIFTKQKTEKIFKENLISDIDTKINFYKQHLKIAEDLDLQNPVLKSMLEANNNHVIFTIQEAEKFLIKKFRVDQSIALFYHGTKILSQMIIILNELKNDANNLTLNNLFLEKASFTEQTSKSTLVFVVFGFMLGLLISLIIIFIRA
jgi:LPS O-antigen subunit length determinant protein (WzzB/FepE family)